LKGTAATESENALVTAGSRLTAQTSHELISAPLRRSTAWTTYCLRPACVGRRVRSTSLSAPGARAKGAAGLRRSSLGADEKHCTGPSCPWEAGPLSSALACDAC